MIESIIYVFFALIGLGFLVFIHELGHYFMAKRVGMRIETFSIGFGKPLYVWERDGVKWQICILPFGGYVRIAGMEKKGGIEPYQILDGFFGKKPKERIKVALMGPIVNLVFALLAFTVIWAVGGREKPFAEFTQYVGWVEPNSKLYIEGIRPGDQLIKADQRTIEGFTDLFFAAAFDNEPLTIEGFKRDYGSGEKKPFCVQIDEEKKFRTLAQQLAEVRMLTPASFLLYREKLPTGAPNILHPGSPMENSGILYGDRIVWVDGQPIFSLAQLSFIINQPRVLLTVKRGSDVFLTRIPRLHAADLQMNESQKAELDDWRVETGLKTKLSDVYFIPYILDHECQVESAISYVDEFSQHCSTFQAGQFNTCPPSSEKSLLPGDKILAVDGRIANNAFECLQILQQRHTQIIVARQSVHHNLSWQDANRVFIGEIDWPALHTMEESIGTTHLISHHGNLHLLNPVTPKAVVDFPQSSTKSKWIRDQEEARLAIEKIADPDKKAIAIKQFEQQQKKVLLGIALQDQWVRYNPQPFALFDDVFLQVGQTLKALFTGILTPKAMQGPVGIVQVMQNSWGLGAKEALFWLGVISLNLGIFNLLPIPVLDGGHICFALWEAVTKKPIKSRTMERLIVPFVVLLIALLIFTTYNDIMRLFKGLFF